MRDQPGGPGAAAAGALARSLRLEAGLSTRRLAARAAVAKSTVNRLEAGQLRPRRSMLAVIAIGIDPDRAVELTGQLVAAAAGDLAEDTPGWRRYRRRRVGRGLRSGVIPVPASVAKQLRMHQAADDALRQVMQLQAQPGFWSDPRNGELADRLIEQAEAVRAKAGPHVSIPAITQMLTEGMEDQG